jgi:hypothetical protein
VCSFYFFFLNTNERDIYQKKELKKSKNKSKKKKRRKIKEEVVSYTKTLFVVDELVPYQPHVKRKPHNEIEHETKQIDGCLLSVIKILPLNFLLLSSPTLPHLSIDSPLLANIVLVDGDTS